MKISNSVWYQRRNNFMIFFCLWLTPHISFCCQNVETFQTQFVHLVNIKQNDKVEQSLHAIIVLLQLI